MNAQNLKENFELSRSLKTAATLPLRSARGHSIIEMLIVVALVGVVSSIALPQLIVQRRITRSIGISNEIMTQLRETRQLAMSQRQAFTFLYDDAAKTISIIDHNLNPGGALLVMAGYPNTAGSTVVQRTPIAETSISADMTYGIPSGLPTGALSDGVALTALVNQKFTVTFQPDGSVVDSAGDPQGRAIFIYNSRVSAGTASAISVMGASGRAKIWRYVAATNAYAE